MTIRSESGASATTVPSMVAFMRHSLLAGGSFPRPLRAGRGTSRPSAGGDDLAVQVQQARNLFAARTAHAAFGADAPGATAARAGRQGSVDETHLITGGARRGV